MQYLFDQWEQVKIKLGGKHVLFLFDYDGTLASIAQTPQQAVISKDTKELLQELVQKPNCTLAIISGRALEDIKHIVGLEGIIYAGNHGLEIEGPKIKFESQVSSRFKLIIRNIYEDMASKLSKIKGVLIEDKGLAIGVHYRLVDEKDMQEFLSIFSNITEPFTVHNKIAINEGKKVYEIRAPLAWDKGKTALWLLARQQFMSGDNKVFPVYIGDDVTDEDAFKVLKNIGLTIFVGEQASSEAQYYLKNTAEVTKFLRLISDLIIK